MKCEKCGMEYEGTACPNCQENVVAVEQPRQAEPKKKKPFYIRWWFILLSILSILIIVIALSSGGESIDWEEMVLGSKLPEPPASSGEIYSNSAEELRLDIENVSAKEYDEYINTSKSKGFTVEAKSESYSYSAYNADGYKLSLSYYESDEEMSISLEAPMEMTDIVWPTSKAGKLLPKPKSTIGNFSYEYDDNFLVYVGNTSRDDYEEYVNACSKKGFNVDYSKGDDYYYADNKDGWGIDIRYEGNNVMKIYINGPDEETELEEPEESEEPAETTDDEDIRADFKKAMDSYEEFMDEYVAFMKKYKANPTDTSLLTDYSNYMSKYSEFVADYSNWQNEDLNDAELKYYLDVQTRVNKKLLEVSQ